MATSKKPRKTYKQKVVYQPGWITILRVIQPIKDALDLLYFNEEALTFKDSKGNEYVGMRFGYDKILVLYEAVEDIARHIMIYSEMTKQPINVTPLLRLADALKTDQQIYDGAYKDCMQVFSNFESLARKDKDPFLQSKVHQEAIKRYGLMVYASKS